MEEDSEGTGSAAPPPVASDKDRPHTPKTLPSSPKSTMRTPLPADIVAGSRVVTRRRKRGAALVGDVGILGTLGRGVCG